MDFLPHAIIFLTEAAAAAVGDMMERNWKIIEQTRRGLCRGWNAARQEILQREELSVNRDTIVSLSPEIIPLSSIPQPSYLQSPSVPVSSKNIVNVSFNDLLNRDVLRKNIKV